MRGKTWKHLNLPPLVHIAPGRKMTEERRMEIDGQETIMLHNVQSMKRLRLLGVPWSRIGERYDLKGSTVKAIVQRHYPDVT
jgi:hypothetical protein